MTPVQRGKEMQKLRKAARLTQYAAGLLVDVKPQAVSAWERGENSPSWHRLRTLDDGYSAGGALLALFGDEIDATRLHDLVVEMEALDRDFATMLDLLDGLADQAGLPRLAMPHRRRDAI